MTKSLEDLAPLTGNGVGCQGPPTSLAGAIRSAGDPFGRYKSAAQLYFNSSAANLTRILAATWIGNACRTR